MLETHPTCSRPSSQTKLWRYLDLPRFLSLLQTRSLYFARADHLADPFEGSVSAGTLRERERWLSTLLPERRESQRLSAQRLVEEARKTFFISCWHASAHESAAMWTLYASKNAGIALRSAADRLFEVCGAAEQSIYVTTVKYVDYARVAIPANNTFWPYVYKRKSFQHEREVRALIWLPQLPFNEELRIPISVESLIESVTISPFAQSWFMETVGRAIKQCGFDFPVHQSELAEQPIF